MKSVNSVRDTITAKRRHGVPCHNKSAVNVSTQVIEQWRLLSSGTGDFKKFRQIQTFAHLNSENFEKFDFFSKSDPRQGTITSDHFFQLIQPIL